MFHNLNGVVEIDKGLTKAAHKRAKWAKRAMTPPTIQIDYFKLTPAKRKALEEYTIALTGFKGYLYWLFAERDRLMDIDSAYHDALEANDAMALGTLIIERKAFAVAPAFLAAKQNLLTNL
jgi:hypothetical protein